MAPPEDPTAEERQTFELIEALKESGNLRPLVALLRDGDVAPERAREALLLLGELDLDLLVKVALDTLIGDHVGDPGLAVQIRHATRDDPA